MKDVTMTLLLTMTLALVLCGAQALAQIPDPPVVDWDIVYEGNTLPDTPDPNASIPTWTLSGSDGTAAVVSDPNTDNNWLHIDTDGGTGERYYIAPDYGEPNNPDPNLPVGMTVVWRCRFYDGTLHSGGVRFGDGSYGVDIRYGYNSATGHIPGFIRYEDGSGRAYDSSVDDQWHEYWLTVWNESSYKFWRDGVEIRLGVPAYDGSSTGYFGAEFHFGDQFGSTSDVIADYDYVRIKMDEAVPRVPPVCGDSEHPLTAADIVPDCVTDMNDLAVMLDDFFIDTRP